MPCKVWDGIPYPFPNFNGPTVEVWEWMNNLISCHVLEVNRCKRGYRLESWPQHRQTTHHFLVQICMHVMMCMCLYVCVCARVRACAGVCVCICVSVYICTCSFNHPSSHLTYSWVLFCLCFCRPTGLLASLFIFSIYVYMLFWICAFLICQKHFLSNVILDWYLMFVFLYVSPMYIMWHWALAIICCMQNEL